MPSFGGARIMGMWLGVLSDWPCVMHGFRSIHNCISHNPLGGLLPVQGGPKGCRDGCVVTSETPALSCPQEVVCIMGHLS